jgi:hypothetical protein
MTVICAGGLSHTTARRRIFVSIFSESHSFELPSSPQICHPWQVLRPQGQFWSMLLHCSQHHNRNHNHKHLLNRHLSAPLPHPNLPPRNPHHRNLPLLRNTTSPLPFLTPPPYPCPQNRNVKSMNPARRSSRR